jgi:hypothetical protein
MIRPLQLSGDRWWTTAADSSFRKSGVHFIDVFGNFKGLAGLPSNIFEGRPGSHRDRKAARCEARGGRSYLGWPRRAALPPCSERRSPTNTPSSRCCCRQPPGAQACYARTYDKAHLAEHPKQKVTEMIFSLRYTTLGEDEAHLVATEEGGVEKQYFDYDFTLAAR